MPGVLADVPVIVRGALTGLLARPTSKKSIGTVFQERAARYGDRVFMRFGDQQLTYREANATANRYAAVLAARGVGHGDVVGIMLRNSPNAVLVMLAAVKCGAVAGMLNYHQRGEVLAHSLGLLDAKVLIAESDLVSAVDECGGPDATAALTIEDLERFAATAPTTNPASASAVLARDTAFYIFTSGTTGLSQGQRDDPQTVAGRAGRVRRAGVAAEGFRHALQLPAAVPQQRADGRGIVGDQLRGDAGAGQVVLGVAVLGRGDRQPRPPRSSTSARSAGICSTSRPSRPTARTRCG